MMTCERLLGRKKAGKTASGRLCAGLAGVMAIVAVTASTLPAEEPPPRTALPTPRPEAAGPGAFPPPAPLKDPSHLGHGVQRTMTLLASSTPRHRNHVRVLFYGQSLTEQEWSKQVAADLRRRFPSADLEIENRAIGGFASQLLIRPAEHDLYPFYPDLVIFHVFGANQQYEQIIRSIRSRTTAEVLMQGDRIGEKWPLEQPDEKADKGQQWEYFMNHRFLPATAAKYGCGLCDINAEWLAYLRANHYEPLQLLLKDKAHFNAHGNYLMAQLTSRYLVHRPDLPDAAWKDLAKAYPVDEGAWKEGKLAIRFDGNRVDVLPMAPKSKGAASAAGGRVFIDGKKPSDFPAAYRITRPQPGPWSPLFLSRVDHDAPLVLEDWTLRVSHVSADGKTWQFDAHGSVTGPDGSGRSDRPFTGKSGRVKIDPAAWFRGFDPPSHRLLPLPDGYTIRWKVLPMFADTYRAVKIVDPALENATTVVQGIANARHTLEIIADDPARPPAIAIVRTYRPPVKAD